MYNRHRSMQRPNRYTIIPAGIAAAGTTVTGISNAGTAATIAATTMNATTGAAGTLAGTVATAGTDKRLDRADGGGWFHGRSPPQAAALRGAVSIAAS